MSTTQAPSRDAAGTTQTPSATPQDKRPAASKIAPEFALGAAAKNHDVLGVGGMLALQAAAGNRAVVGLVQAKRARSSTEDSARVHEAAKLGIGGASGALPHLERIQQSFGRYDVTGVAAHTGAQATAGAQAMGAAAFTVGNHVAFAGTADLRTAAHEAAHAVQQCGGVQLNGGVGEVGDEYERHADQVADAVVQGKSAEALLERYADGEDGSARVAGAVQRQVKITFEGPVHEMEDFDTSTAKIINVIATRDQKNVAVENKFPASQQRAHTTSHTVFTNMFVRDLDQKTWAEAWKLLRERYQFLETLLTRWYADDKLKVGVNSNLKDQLPVAVQAQIAVCDNHLQREGHQITNPLWAARPKVGTAADWKYYDHSPDAADGVDPATHFIKPWRPLLTSIEIKKLEDACEMWITLRGQFPWTSVAADSYVTGDAVGPGAVESAAAKHVAKANLSDTEAKEISDAIIVTFDFFPPSLTETRKYEHAAGVAARHVVEHFRYHASIKPAWRDTIANQFLKSWKGKIKKEKKQEEDQTAAAEKQKKYNKSKAAKIGPGRNTDGLGALQAVWAQIEIEYNRIYASLKTAIV